MNRRLFIILHCCVAAWIHFLPVRGWAGSPKAPPDVQFKDDVISPAFRLSSSWL